MTFSISLRGLCKMRRRSILHIIKTYRYLVFVPLFLFVIVLHSDILVHDRMLPDSVRYVYLRPSGLVKELYPENEWVQFRTIPFDDEFRYPMEIDMTKLTELQIKGNGSLIRAVNEHNFNYLKNPHFLCPTKSNSSSIPLLILIKSAPQYHGLRNVIRKTWGKELRKRGRYKMAFLLGYSSRYQHYIDIEHYSHQDIIQEDFIDAYWNNTYKTIMAFNWASQYCSNARTVLFLDDDMFVNLNNLEKYVLDLDERRNPILFSGILAERGTPVRDVKSKWYVPWQDYPYDCYPNYLAGSAIFASINVVRMFSKVFPYVRYFGIDDVYLGIVAYKLNITPSRTLHLDNDNLRNFKNLSQLIANHGFRDHVLYKETYLNSSFLDML